MKEFFAMGGYAFYVWTSFALSAVVMLINLLSALRRKKVVINQLKKQAENSQSQVSQP